VSNGFAASMEVERERRKRTKKRAKEIFERYGKVGHIKKE